MAPVEAIDRPELEENFAGDQELLAEAIAAYLAEVPKMLGTMTCSCQAGDLAALRQVTHRLRGSLVLVAARPAEQIAAGWEEKAAGGDLEGARRDCARLGPALATLEQALRDLVEGSQGT